jgi:leucyl aminopeptidase
MRMRTPSPGRWQPCRLARDLVNTPANDMGPDAAGSCVSGLAKRYKAKTKVVTGDALLTKGTFR